MSPQETNIQILFNLTFMYFSFDSVFSKCYVTAFIECHGVPGIALGTADSEKK